MSEFLYGYGPHRFPVIQPVPSPAPRIETPPTTEEIAAVHDDLVDVLQVIWHEEARWRELDRIDRLCEAAARLRPH